MIPFKGVMPDIDSSVYIAMHTAIVGQVSIEKDSSVWFGAVLRADINEIHIGEGTNMQDKTTVHVGHNKGTWIGKHVTVGHNCVIHGCEIKDRVLIGMNSTILDGAIIGENSIIGAGSLITKNKEFPDGVLIMGSPAKVIRKLSHDEINSIKVSADHYMENARVFMNHK